LLADAVAALDAETNTPSDPARSAVADLAAVQPWLFDDVLAAAQRVRRRTEAIAAMVKGNVPPPVFETASIGSVVDDVSKTLAPTASSKGIRLIREHGPGVPEFRFDHDRLYDCLYNLVNNALPETPDGGRVVVRSRYAEANDEIILEVEDTGRGMPETVRQRLFTPDAVSTKPGGTGLGTSVAARIVREHGGTIFVESEVGRGTRVTIVLPRLRPDHDLPDGG
ncbi:MAG: sensor histidine kinase, partial [Armatimonadota bacterium]